MVTVALSVTIRGSNLRSNVSDAQINRGWVTLCPNLGVFSLEQTRHVGVAKSEHPRLTNGEIIFEEFQPMWSQSTNVTDRRTDRQTSWIISNGHISATAHDLLIYSAHRAVIFAIAQLSCSMIHPCDGDGQTGDSIRALANMLSRVKKVKTR